MAKKKDLQEEEKQQRQSAPNSETAQEEGVSEKENNPDGKREEKQNAPENKAQEYYRQLVCLQADFENYRKRVEKERPALIQYGKMDVLRGLVPMYDILLKAKEEISKDGAETEHIKQGLKMIFEEFEKFFKAQGVQIVCAKGKPYDPMTQEVVTTCPCAGEDDGKVMQEVSQGVVLDGKVIRPAQVIVGKAQEDAQKEEKEEQEEKETQK